MWNSQAEAISRDALAELQLHQLQRLLRRLTRVPFYKNALAEAGIRARDITSLDDLTHLPFTRKTDLRDHYPFGLLATPLEDTVRVHGSSGTTGRLTVVAYTKRDLRTWSEVMARTLAAGGVTRRDVVHVAYGYGLFTGGLGVHYGVERIGATVVPASGGNTLRQIALIRDFGATVLCSTPSFALYLAEASAEVGVDLYALALKTGFFGAEPWTEAMRSEIERKLGIRAYDIYGLSEVIGPGVSYECDQHAGLHINEDVFLPEVINPATGEPLPDGVKGELVFTTLTKQALPLLRYRTGDITALNHETCKCGRTTVRMNKVSGRTDDMLIIRGVNVFPSQIEEALLHVPGVSPNYMIIVDRAKNILDTLEVWVEVDAEAFSDKLGRLADLQRAAERHLYEIIGINAYIKLVEPNTIARSEGKAKRVVDRRDVYQIKG
ncbi:MAG: phenylacetate--CoA ligase [Chloroflexi bacterium]|nr:phenylacetate--CoA ligase [Chloroflexota bacterium]